MSNSQLNELKSGINNGTEVTLKISRIIFCINCYKLIHKFQRLVKLSQKIPQLI